MNDSQSQQLIEQASQQLRRGNKAEAQTLLRQFLNQEPNSADAWYLFAATLVDRKNQIRTLQRVLELNPFHEKAANALRHLEDAQPVASPQASPTPFTDTRTFSAQQVIEDQGGGQRSNSPRVSPLLLGFGITASLIIILLLSVIAGRIFFTPTAQVVVQVVTATPPPTSPVQLTATLMSPPATITLPASWTPVAFAGFASSTPKTVIQTQTALPPPIPIPPGIPPRKPNATNRAVIVPSATATPTMSPDQPAVVPLMFGAYPIAVDYSRDLDRFIYIAESPHAVHLMNPSDGSESTITLSRAPLSLSVSGTKAAVGHDALVSYVDLTSATVLQTFEVSSQVTRLALSPLGWIYTNKEAIDLKTGTARDFGAGYYYGIEPLVLHPDNTRLYGATVGLSPDDIYRIELNSDGSPQGTSKDSPYHGDHSMCENIWISEDGKRLFTACGNIFRSSSVDAQDMVYNGSFSRSRRIVGLTHFLKEKRVIVLGTETDLWGQWKASNVVIYDYDLLNPLASFPMPDVQVGGRTFTATGKAIFHREDNNTYFIVVKVNESAGLLNNIGIITQHLEDMPSRDKTTIVSTLETPFGNEGFAALPFNVIDAEYSKALDRIIAVAAYPSRLLIIDPESGATTSITLPRDPTTVSLAQDGLNVAIGHDALVTLLNLQSPSELHTLDLNTKASDIAYGPNGWLYIMPERSQWQTITCIEIATNNFQSCWRVHAASIIKLNPTSGALYYANRGLMPSGMERFDITDMENINGRRGPYHGEYEPCGNIWFSEDGKRIFGACGYTYRASSSPSDDMKYSGQLQIPPPNVQILSLADSAVTKRVVAVLKNSLDIIIFDNQSLEMLSHSPALADSAKDQFVNSFVFFNAAGTHYMVILVPNSTLPDSAFAGVFTLKH